MTAQVPSQLELVLGLDDADDEAALRRRAAKQLGCAPEQLGRLRLLKRSLDARHGRVRFRLLVALNAAEPSTVAASTLGKVRDGEAPVVVVGAGPAGLFCAHELARAGIASVVVERGKQVRPRRRDLQLLNRGDFVDPDSNYCFGEGGAGTFSDGKLYTRAHKRGNVRDVLEVLVRHGAPEEILVEARPHIGSNRLPRVIESLRDALLEAGVGFAFGSRVTEVLTEGGRVLGVEQAGGERREASEVVVATGHSARDVLHALDRAGAPMEAKGFAVGVRIEHPQPLIDRLQYGRQAGHPRLPAAAYRIVREIDERGVFSFCMCPGGFIVPAATEPGAVVVNGMSPSRRDSPHANSGLVVAVQTEDLSQAGYNGVFGGVQLQDRLERAAARAGGGRLRAPAIRASEFVRGGEAGAAALESSYRPGLTPADLAGVLDSTGLSLSGRLRQALKHFEQRMPGYAGDEGIMVGVESRTSSPVRVLRDEHSLESPGVAGLYPCGEGAGYAGGIVSAALDGMRVARAIVQRRSQAS